MRKIHKNTSRGALAISNLSRISLKELIDRECYIKYASEKFGVSYSIASKHIRRRMEALKVFVPVKGSKSPIQYYSQPFSKNEMDYGTRQFKKKLENSPILPVHNELTEVVEWYKIQLIPTI